MALHALNFCMLAKQGKLRLGVVERSIQSKRHDLAPSGCGMARLARLRESAAVRIGMTIDAVAKRDSRIAWLFVAIRRVAPSTSYFGVQAC